MLGSHPVTELHRSPFDKATSWDLSQSVISASFSYLQWSTHTSLELTRFQHLENILGLFLLSTTAQEKEAVPRMTCQLLDHVYLNGLMQHSITRDTSIPSPALEAGTFEIVDNSKTFLKLPGSESLAMGGHTTLQFRDWNRNFLSIFELNCFLAREPCHSDTLLVT